MSNIQFLGSTDFSRCIKQVAWRCFQVLIVIPASTVATVLLVMAASGYQPVTQGMLAVHQWAETAVRPAPAGMYLSSECAEQPSGDNRSPIHCDQLITKAVPIQEGAIEATRTVTELYFILVVLSYGGLMVFSPRLVRSKEEKA